jgi:Domain of unknown function (DUF4082)/Domain of unknown function (DUF1929)/Bacterial Ig domain
MRTLTTRQLASCATLLISLGIPALIQAQTCPCSIWSSSTTPGNVAASDPGPVELGVKFRTSQAGFITGIRFYKGSGNSGTHVGKLWSSTGTLLGSANFAGETATGWQQVSLAAPVAVAANTTYVASYYAPNGHYSYNFNYFTSGVSNPPLTALADGVDGPNGVFLYASGGGFPNQTSSQGNYWVDVVFATAVAPTWGISGTITSGGSSTVSLTGAATATTTADASGNYTFTGLANGSYTVTPSKTGFTFTPVNQAVTINNANATAVNFTAQAVPTWSISGTITSGGSSTVNLTGAATATTTADASGNYTFSGLTNGSYTVTPSKTGFTFTPVNQAVTISSANVTAANFTAQAVPTWSISGVITSGGSATVNLTGAATATTTADASGNYTFSGLVNGSYTVTPSKTGFTFTPVNQAVTISSANATAVNFTAQVAIVTTSIWSSSTTPANVAASDPGPVELGVKFRTSQAGFITGIRFYKGSGNSGTHVGKLWSSTGTLLGSANFAGETATGWQQVSLAAPVAVAANTTYVASYYAPNGHYSYNFNYFTSGVSNPPLTALADGVDGPNGVFLYASGGGFPNQTSSQGNYWVDVVFATAVAPTWGISGTITSGGSSTVSLTGAATATTTADASGNYTFTGLANGSYTVTPSKTGFTFTPVNQAVTINNANATAVNFTAQAIPTWSISGTITSGASSTVNLTGAATATTTADASGNYTFSGLVNGSYTVTPSKTGFTFTPVNRAVTISSANATAVNFTAQAVPTWSISGVITSGGSSTVNLTGTATATTTADASGNYTFSGLVNGSYTVTPSKTGFTFTPVNQAVTINSANATAVNFTAQAVPTWSISGLITSGGSSTVNLTGAATATTTADASGNYTFTGLANGSYTVTPSKTGFTFTPVNQAVTINSANATAVNFTAQSASGCPCSIWTTSTLPGTQSANDSSSVELGMKFRASQSGYITGLKFFKGLSNTGTHVANLWSSTGSLLATAIFSNEGVSGWQQVDFPSPVSIIANTTYVASYFAPVAGYAVDVGYFASAVASGPLRALANGEDGGNGVYLYGAHSGFPTSTYGSSNYWVDIVFTTSITSNPPSATSDSYSVLQAQTLSVATPGVLTNDIDPNGYALTATLVTNVSHGTLTLSGNGAFTYVPTPSFIGQDTFTYKANDRVQTSNVATATITVNAGPPLSQVGSWGAPTAWPTVAINSVLMHTGQVLVYEDSGVSANVWDPTTGNFVAVPNNFTDLFCSGHVALPDGRILVIGGHGADYNTDIGTADANIFDPATLQWTSAPKMAYRRWYPTATTLPDGRVLAMSGNDVDASSYVTIPEIYNPTTNTWTAFTAANLQLPIYPHMFVLPSGKVAYTGNSEGDSYPGPLAGSRNTRTLDLTTGAWTTVAATTIDGDSVMYAPGKILKVGSSNSGCFDEGASTNVAFTIDLTQASPVWQPTGSMAFPRTHHNLTLLPDGSVLVIGGGQMKNGCTPSVATPVFQAELWSPTTGTWSALSSMVTPRLYHSTAILLPDGRVLVAGGGRDEDAIDYLNAEIFTPPYIYKGTRPSTTSVPSSTTYGANFVVATPDASTIASVVLMHPSATTHAFDEDQKRVNLTFSQTSGGITVTAPANSNLAPPGYYTLFLVNQTGVPSVASFIRLQ